MCICLYVKYIYEYMYHSSGGGLDDPGVLWSDEAETVESSQVTIHLLLKAETSPNLPTETHPELKHDCPR